jgi:hypothetical protein
LQRLEELVYFIFYFEIEFYDKAYYQGDNNSVLGRTSAHIFIYLKSTQPQNVKSFSLLFLSSMHVVAGNDEEHWDTPMQHSVQWLVFEPLEFDHWDTPMRALKADQVGNG